MRKNCLLKHVTEEKIEGRGRRGRKRNQLLGELRENRRYWTLKEEAQDRSLRRSGFGSDMDLSSS